MEDQASYFQARIRRINDPKNSSYLDPETGMRIPKRLSRQIIKTNNSARTEQRANLGSMLFSVILGCFALVAARYIRFELAGVADTGTDPATLAAMDAGLAAMIVFFVGGVLKHKTLRHMMAQVVGITAMMVTMHNLVWLFPAEFAQAFSQDYVEQVTAATAPLSIYFNGETIVSL